MKLYTEVPEPHIVHPDTSREFPDTDKEAMMQKILLINARLGELVLVEQSLLGDAETKTLFTEVHDFGPRAGKCTDAERAMLTDYVARLNTAIADVTDISTGHRFMFEWSEGSGIQLLYTYSFTEPDDDTPQGYQCSTVTEAIASYRKNMQDALTSLSQN